VPSIRDNLAACMGVDAQKTSFNPPANQQP
jgi:hypothetical protein